MEHDRKFLTDSVVPVLMKQLGNIIPRYTKDKAHVSITVKFDGWDEVLLFGTPEHLLKLPREVKDATLTQHSAPVLGADIFKPDKQVVPHHRMGDWHLSLPVDELLQLQLLRSAEGLLCQRS